MAHLKWHEIWSDEEKTFLRKFVEKHQIPTLDRQDIARIKEADADKRLHERQSKFQIDNPIWYKLYLFNASGFWFNFVLTVFVMCSLMFFVSPILSLYWILSTIVVLSVSIGVWWFYYKGIEYPEGVLPWRWVRREYEGEILIKEHPFPEFKFSILPYEVNTREPLAQPLLKLELESSPASNFEFLVLSSNDGSGEEYYVGYQEKVVSPTPVNRSAELLESL